MMHAVTDEHFEVAVIEHHRNVNGDFLVRIFQEAVQTLFEAQFSRGGFKARIGGFVNIEFVVHCKRGHGKRSSSTRPVAFATCRTTPTH